MEYQVGRGRLLLTPIGRSRRPRSASLSPLGVARHIEPSCLCFVLLLGAEIIRVGCAATCFDLRQYVAVAYLGNCSYFCVLFMRWTMLACRGWCGAESKQVIMFKYCPDSPDQFNSQSE